MSAKIRTGDHVLVIAGSNKGQTGDVVSVNGQFVTIEGVNMRTKHIKATKQEQGRLVWIEGKIHASNVSHFNPETKKPIRVGFELDNGAKYLVNAKNREQRIRKA